MMGNDRHLITEAQQLIGWLDENDILMNLSESHAELLINYMEDHGYQLGISSHGLIRIDSNPEMKKVEAITIDEIIDSVCEWNYEMLQYAKENLKSARGTKEFHQTQKYFNGLKADEKILDELFGKTCYGKEFFNLAKKLTAEIHLHKGGNKGKVALVVSDAIKDYETEYTKGKVR